MRERFVDVEMARRRQIPKWYPVRRQAEVAPLEKTLVAPTFPNSPQDPQEPIIKTFPKKQIPFRRGYPRRPRPAIFPHVRPLGPHRRAA